MSSMVYGMKKLLTHLAWELGAKLRRQTTERIETYMAHKCGGQLSVTDVLNRFGPPLWTSASRLAARRRLIDEAKRLGIERGYTDVTGRFHRFFTLGEGRAVARALKASMLFEPQLGDVHYTWLHDGQVLIACRVEKAG